MSCKARSLSNSSVTIDNRFKSGPTSRRGIMPLHMLKIYIMTRKMDGGRETEIDKGTTGDGNDLDSPNIPHTMLLGTLESIKATLHLTSRRPLLFV